MSTIATQTYREKLLLLDIDRKFAGGILPDEVEIQRTAEFDAFWNQMTTEEQDATEKWAAGPENAPTDLGLVDVVVKSGDTHLPRIKA